MPASTPRFDRPAFEAHLARGRQLLASGAFEPAIDAFEAAHLIAQRFTIPHTRSHVAFLAVGWARRDLREIAGQLLRISWSALFTWLWVPGGNRGSARVAAWRSESSRTQKGSARQR